MVDISCFSLLSSFISDFQVVANPEFDNKREEETTYTAEADCAIRPDGTFMVTLAIVSDLDGKDSHRWAYHYQIQSFAHLAFNNSAEEEATPTQDELRAAALAFGVQVLFGLSREHLHIMTWRGPWKNHPITLELCSVQPYVSSAKERWAAEK